MIWYVGKWTQQKTIDEKYSDIIKSIRYYNRLDMMWPAQRRKKKKTFIIGASCNSNNNKKTDTWLSARLRIARNIHNRSLSLSFTHSLIHKHNTNTQIVHKENRNFSNNIYWMPLNHLRIHSAQFILLSYIYVHVLWNDCGRQNAINSYIIINFRFECNGMWSMHQSSVRCDPFVWITHSYKYMNCIFFPGIGHN